MREEGRSLAAARRLPQRLGPNQHLAPKKTLQKLRKGAQPETTQHRESPEERRNKPSKKRPQSRGEKAWTLHKNSTAERSQVPAQNLINIPPEQNTFRRPNPFDNSSKPAPNRLNNGLLSLLSIAEVIVEGPRISFPPKVIHRRSQGQAYQFVPGITFVAVPMDRFSPCLRPRGWGPTHLGPS
ncbi:hypothetical protein OIU84_026841 [Salix udensis]|uniref:Uncharacterized protein n=1 Tax=Salix udensis TaxID=889485 RepID=A0AAD6J6H4_9ROSI|nr:hypothetical protein OIU84_026841 [Salix udensis]